MPRAACALLAALAACAPDEPAGRASAFEGLASAPANAWFTCSWEGDAMRGLRRALATRFDAGAGGGLGALVDAPSGRWSLVAPEKRGTPAQIVFQALVRDDELGRGASILEGLARDRFVRTRRPEGTLVAPAAWPEGYAPLARPLGTLSWFEAAARAIPRGEDEAAAGGRVALACDLSEALRLLTTARRDDAASRVFATIPGMAGFRSLLVEAREGSRVDSVRGVLGFARTPVGFAKALDVEAAPLRFVAPLRALERARGESLSFSVQRVDVGVLIDSVGLAAGAVQLGPFGPDPLALLRSFRLGRVLTRAFWGDLGREFAFVARDLRARAPELCALARVLDRASLRPNLEEVFGEAREEAGGVARFSRRIAGLDFVVLLGAHTVALSTSGLEEIAEELVKRDVGGGAGSGEARSLYSSVAAGIAGLERSIELRGARVAPGLYFEAKITQD